MDFYSVDQTFQFVDWLHSWIEDNKIQSTKEV